MWICLNNAFLSIVAHRNDESLLLVRARVMGHIERVFPKAKVTITEDADYRYRAEVRRDVVGEMLFDKAQEITYTNFKNSVVDKLLHDAYMAFWSVMYRLQTSLQPRKPRDRSVWTARDSMLARSPEYDCKTRPKAKGTKKT